MVQQDALPGCHGLGRSACLVRLAYQQDLHLNEAVDSPPSRVVWRAASAEELAWAALDGGHAVHHRPSGLTHVVDALMVTLLQDVLREPRTLEDAAMLLATAQQSIADDAMLERLADVVGRLESLGLVRRDLAV